MCIYIYPVTALSLSIRKKNGIPIDRYLHPQNFWAYFLFFFFEQKKEYKRMNKILLFLFSFFFFLFLFFLSMVRSKVVVVGTHTEEVSRTFPGSKKKKVLRKKKIRLEKDFPHSRTSFLFSQPAAQLPAPPRRFFRGGPGCCCCWFSCFPLDQKKGPRKKRNKSRKREKRNSNTFFCFIFRILFKN